jgi:hypothetical protein
LLTPAAVFRGALFDREKDTQLETHRSTGELYLALPRSLAMSEKSSAISAV